MPKNCDNTSVGVIIERNRNIALLRRARFPIAMAPPAGHIDDHGSPEQASLDEVAEELGLIIALGGLKKTPINNRYVNNRCRRPGGDHHYWTVFTASQFSGELNPSADEAKGAGWYPIAQVQHLADLTAAYARGEYSEEEWQARPGLEPVWVTFMAELGYIQEPCQ